MNKVNHKKLFKSIFIVMFLSLLLFVVSGCRKDDKIILSFAKETHKLTVGDTLEFKPNVSKGKDVGEVVLEYSSQDDSVVTYKDGILTAIGIGETQIVVKVKGTEISATATINVIAIDDGDPIKLNVIFEDVDGSEIKTVAVEKGEKIAKPKDPTKEGYKFLGWYLGETKFNFDTVITKDTTIVAKWEKITEKPLKYTVTFNSDGGTTVDSIGVEDGNKISKPADPTKDGFKFLGWFVENEEFDFNTPITKDITLVAKWKEIIIEPTMRTVTFNSEGGSSIPAIEVEDGQKISKPVEPTKDGFKFLGWLLQGEIFDFDTPITKDITLVAKWDKIVVDPIIYTVTFNTDGGSEILAVQVETGKTISKPTDPSKPGYVFKGWLLDGKPFSFDTIIDSDITLVAKWEEEQVKVDSVIIELHNYTPYKDKEDLIVEFLTDFYTYLGEPGDFNEFMHGSGKTSGFDGKWHSEHKAKIYAGPRPTEANASENLFISSPEYYLKWLPFFDMMEDFVLTVNSTQSFYGAGTWTGLIRIREYIANIYPSGHKNDETMAMMPKYAIIEKELTEDYTLPTPEKVGYKFIGWYNNVELSGDKITSVSVDSSGVVKVYASWEEDFIAPTEYKINYNLEGGTNPSDAISVFTKEDLGKALPIPTREGYEFEGWFKNNFYLGDEVTKITEEKDLTLFAKWKKISKPEPTVYTVYYEVNGGVLEDEQGTFIEEDLPFALPIPIRADYEFMGWYQEADFSGSAITNITEPKNYTLYAKWEKVKKPEPTVYSISYELNGGILDGKKESFIEADLPISLQKPSKDEYKFIGWFESADFSGSAITNLIEAKNYTLYAKWEKIDTPDPEPTVYSITYELNGGTLEGGIEEFTAEDLPLALGIPTKAGFEFKGWFETADFSGVVVENIAEAKNITLYAKWEKVVIPDPTTYKLNYHLNNGVFFNSLDEFKLEFLSDFYTHINPDEELNTFIHGEGKTSGYAGTWSTYINHEEDEDMLLYKVNTKSRDASLPHFINQPEYYDKWIDFFELMHVLIKETNPDQVEGLWGSLHTGPARLKEFMAGTRYNNNNPHNLSNAPEKKNAKTRILSLLVVPRDLITSYDTNTESFNLIVPARYGYIFKGWYLSPDFSGDVVERLELPTTGDKNFYAKWEAVKRTVTLDVEGTKSTFEIDHDSVFNKPADPIKNRYKFIGWFLGDAEYNFSSIVTEDITLTAKFDIITHTVIVNIDGEKTTHTVETQTKFAKPADPIKDGYDFVGWYVGEQEYDFSKEVITDLEIVAKFELKQEEKEFTVKFVDGSELLAEVIVLKDRRMQKPLDPEKIGYKFVAWLLDGVAYDFNNPVTANITLVADWEELQTAVLPNAKAALENPNSFNRHHPYGFTTDNKLEGLPTTLAEYPTVTITWRSGDTNEITNDLRVIKQRFLYFETNLIATLSSPGEEDIEVTIPVNVGIVHSAEAYAFSMTTRAAADDFDIDAYNAENGFENEFDGGTSIAGRGFNTNGLAFKSTFKYGNVETDYYFFFRKESAFAELEAKHTTKEGDGENAVYRITSSPKKFSGSYLKGAYNTTDKPMVIKGNQLNAILGFQQHNAYQLYIYDGEGNRVNKYAGVDLNTDYVIPAGGYLIERGYIDGAVSNTGNVTAVSLAFFENAEKIEVIRFDRHPKLR